MRQSDGLEVKSGNQLKDKDLRTVNKATDGDRSAKSSENKTPGPDGLEMRPGSETAKTDQEMTEELDGKLTTSIAAFQRQLLQDNQMEEQSDGNSPGSEGQDGAGISTPGSPSAANFPGLKSGNDNSSGAGLLPPLPSAQRSGDFQSEKTSATNRPKVLGDGYDEVVARQLREAAENETDPVLREKLWKEYQKYTGGVGR